ncbi:Transmembrane amino acid transporter protein [Histomonas meleagridis]|uniref:Transmembrane amino acid transporter protein n=1 Tax=Histomonas meleagridis TaxID=135588 RepID=UPI003559B1B1|nr:Transmembrane amino acid transporter protein [Histomonas meleagridis]KAH0804712.1 Transmembrane amino acid transporter protein [Histomonas meleagridis]
MEDSKHFSSDAVSDDGNPIAISDGDERSMSKQSIDTENVQKLEDEEEEIEDTPKKRITRFQAIMSCLNSLLGAGILSIPNSFTYCGIVPSLIILTLVAVLSHVSTVLTVKLQRRVNSDGLDDLAFKTLGRAGQLAISILSMLFLISAMVAYLIISSDNVISWLSLANIKIDVLWKRVILVLINSLILPIALTIPRTGATIIGKLSVVSFVLILFFCVAMVVKAIQKLPNEGVADISIAKMDFGVFSSISIYGLAFALPVVILPLINPYNTDIHKREVVSLWSIILCYVVVIIPGILGYLMFGSKTESIILSSFPDNDVLIIIVRVGFYIVVILSYPSIGLSLMSSWSQIIFKTVKQAELPALKRALVLVLTNIIPLAFAVFLPNARPALSIGGALGGCLVDFFFPPFIWIRISKKKFLSVQNILCAIFALFGVVSAGISTYQAIEDAIKSFS